MGLLIAGLVTGIRLWLAAGPSPGLEVSLFWGFVNLILSAWPFWPPQNCRSGGEYSASGVRLPCQLVRGEERLSGIVEDINETGALIRANKQC